MNLNLWLRLLFFVFLSSIIVSPPAFSQNEVGKRHFDEQKLGEYNSDPAFNYSSEYANSDSVLSLLIAYLFGIFIDFFNRPSLGWLGPVAFRILLISGIVIAILLIIRLKFGTAFTKSSKRLNNPYYSSINVESEDYQKLFQESFQKGEYKLTARYLFLHSLSILEDKDYVKVMKWKAPYEYLNELPEDKRNAFRQLAGLFESSWYGDKQPTKQDIEQGINQLQSL